MYRGLYLKFMGHPHLKSLLLSTAGSVIVEASPDDLFWGAGREGEGLSYLGQLLMKLRTELLAQESIEGAQENPLQNAKVLHWQPS